MIEEIPLLLLLRKNKSLFLPTLIIIVTAFFSYGFLHPDEHFQILELLLIKLKGEIIDPSIFNWDYHLKIRAWLQPFIYFLFSYPLQFLDGFQMATVIRLFNGLLGLYAIKKFLCLYWPEEQKKLHNVLLLTLCTWYVPLLLVRTNSESLSTSFFLLGYYFYEQRKKPFSMIFLSLSFLVRYQMALVICPLILVDLLKRKICPFTLIKMSFCFVVMVSFGALVDYWGYGTWSLTPYNYFFENLVQDKASDFGVSPFYYYFTKPFIKGIPPISFVVFIFAVKRLLRDKFNSLTLAMICFVLVHSLIPHKEVRFLNFIYILLAVFAALELQSLGNGAKKLVIAFFVINALIMLKTSFTPAHSRLGLYKEVYDKKYQMLYTPEGDALFKFTMPFYMNRKIQTVEISKALPVKEYRVLTSTFEQYKNYSLKEECIQKYGQYPAWIEKLNFFNWLKRSSFHAIWNCHSYEPI